MEGRIDDRSHGALSRGRPAGHPDSKRADVEGELRSSIADAIEDRLSAGDDRATAERSVLEGLGDPALLGTAYTGQPTYLIGPEIFPIYRRISVRLAAIVIPIMAIVAAAVSVAGGESWTDAVNAAITAALSVAVQVAFWLTLTFVILERIDAARRARLEAPPIGGQWSVEMLPMEPPARVTVNDTVGEIVATFIWIAILLLLRNVSWMTDAAGEPVTILAPALDAFWLPALVGVAVLRVVFYVVVFLRGSWTLVLAAIHGGLRLASAVPVIGLALNGALLNPALADAINWPPLNKGDGPVMVAVAFATAIVTTWEIVDGFRRARRNGSTAGSPAVARVR